MRRRRRYDRKFKEDAVRLVLDSGKTIREVADSLGVDRTCLGRWRQECLTSQDGPEEGLIQGQVTMAELEKENRRLRKELSEAVQHREVLKKAIGIFSRDPDRYTAS
jgi:transposase